MKKRNRIIRVQLEHIYGKQCMLGEPLSKNNYITLHHIIPVRNGGLTTVDNGALLSRFMHQLLHQIEHYYPEEYKYINEYLIYYKNTMDNVEKNNMNSYVKRLERSIR